MIRLQIVRYSGGQARRAAGIAIDQVRISFHLEVAGMRKSVDYGKAADEDDG